MNPGAPAARSAGAGAPAWHAWPARAAWSPPRRGEVDVWRIATGGPPPGGFAGLLSAAERRRAAEFAAPALRDEYVLVHGALRTLLSRYTGQHPATLGFTANRYGKPLLAAARPGACPPRFNLSATPGCALLAVCPRARVGVDVELIREVAHPAALGARCALDLPALEPGERAEDWFFRAWTAKESCTKGLGTGLRAPLDEVRVRLARDGSVRAERAGRRLPGWSLYPLAVGGRYAATLAVGTAGTARIRRWDWASRPIDEERNHGSEL